MIIGTPCRVLAFCAMSNTTSNPDAIVNVEPQDGNQNKDAWVTPVVREYDPAEVTKAAPAGIGADIGIYS
jgi:hypothetical protein